MNATHADHRPLRTLVLSLLAALLVFSPLLTVVETPQTRPAAIDVQRTFDNAYIIPIEGEINEITQNSVERRLKRVRDENIPLVIFELDTPGGALGPTLSICSEIKRLRSRGVKVYAWINTDAYSAGTIIAMATDGILMNSSARMGDCQPIMIAGGGASAVPDEIEAKLTSPLLAELRESARMNGYDMELVLSLIRPEMQVFWIVNRETGERDFVDARQRDQRFGLTSTAATADDDDKAPRRHEPIPDSLSKTAWQYVTSVPGLDSVRQPVVDDRELLTMTAVEALAYGFAIARVDDVEGLRDELNISGTPIKLEYTYMESFVSWLASPIVRGVLFLLMVLGAYAEFHTPGFGLAGSVALIALLLFLGAPYMAGFVVTWEIVVIIAGLVLVGIEIFVIPGFGVTGITGMILLVIGLLGTFVPAEPNFGDWPRMPTLPQSYTYLNRGLITLAGGLTGSLLGMFVLARFLPKMPLASRLIAPNPTPEQVMMDDPYEGVALVGDLGRTEGVLRPAGKARFGATLVDVVSEGEYIGHNTRVEVIARHGNRVVVRRVD